MKARGWLWGGLLLLGATGPVQGQELFERTRDLFDEHTFAVHAGGGFATFTEGGTQTVSEPGGSWTVRGTWGMARRLGVEVAYLGAAFPIDTPGMYDANVIQTGMEGLLRLGHPVLPSINSFVTPYLAAGLGWSAFNLVGADDGNVGKIANADGVFSVPMGFGITVGHRQLSADMRLIYRPAFADDMFREANLSNESAGQSTVSFGGSVGYRF